MSSDIATIDPTAIDSNRWYALYVNQNKSSTLGCIYKPGSRSGAITLPSSAPSEEKQRWQIYPLNATTYVLRNQHGGPNTFLGAFFEPKEIAEGQTRPRLARGDIADDTVYWTFGRWGDGTYWMSNGANGTDWHFNIATNNAMTMSRDIAAPQNGQRWGFEAVAVIDDPTFSSVDLLGATVTSPSTATSPPSSATPTNSVTTGSSSPSSSPPPSSSSSSALSSSPSGISTATRAGIGAGIGAGLFIIIMLGLFFYRRRKQRSARHDTAYEPHQATAPSVQTTEPHQHPQAFGKHELYHDSSAAKYEMPAPAMAEVEAYGRPAEFDAHTRPAELSGAEIARGR